VLTEEPATFAKRSPPSSKPSPTGYPEFAVRRETISRFFDPPMPRSTFHDFVNKGKIVPVKGIRGFYRLNDSLRRLGLREVPHPPKESKRATEDILRMAFTQIDLLIFPAPAWMLGVEELDQKDVDHARLVATRCYRVLREHVLRLAPLQRCEELENLYHYLAEVGRENPDLLDLYIEKFSKAGDSRTKLLSKLRKYAGGVGKNQIPWSEILPEDHPPVQTQLTYPGDCVPGGIGSLNHPGMRRLAREARWRHGIGVDRAGEILPDLQEIDPCRLGAWDPLTSKTSMAQLAR
jgi:hypothetical protein